MLLIDSAQSINSCKLAVVPLSLSLTLTLPVASSTIVVVVSFSHTALGGQSERRTPKPPN